MTEKEMFLASCEREFATTMKVLKAYPAAKADLKPHERSKSAKDLAWAFVAEQDVGISGALSGAIDFSKLPAPPDTLAEVIAVFEKGHKGVMAKVSQAPEAALNKTVKFPVGPGKMGDLRVMDVMWGMLNDQIHHRGQLSVYLRMAGGKVPSIYGPSADEPWM
jgi:uncharacterized damage-inducible protein DinB